MTTMLRACSVAVSVLVLVACEGSHASPDARDGGHVLAAMEESAPTLDEAGRGTYWGGKNRQVTLEAGTYTGSKGERVELLRQHYVTGDMEGDGAVDAVVVLAVTNAGAESGRYLAVVRRSGSDTLSIGTAFLGDADVTSIAVKGRQVLIAGSRPNASGQASPFSEVYRLRGGQLVQSPDP